MTTPSGATITVMVNGAARSADAAGSLADLVAMVSESTRGIAVAINADLVPRSLWPTTPVLDGDVVEILTAAPGG